MPSSSPPRTRQLLLLAALSALLALVSFRPVLGDATGRLLGAATDAVHHAWGLWWFAQGEGEGSVSALVSFPTGERGALLSPLVAVGALPWGWLGGPALAYNLACAGVLLGACAGVGLLAGWLARDARAGALAALALLVGRPLLAQLGLGVLEGVSIGLCAASLWAMGLWVERADAGATTAGRAAAGLGVGALAALAVFENPYALVILAPAAGIAAAVRLIREGRAGIVPVLAALAGGLLLVVLRIGLAGGELGGNELTSVRFTWAGRVWEALEGEGSLSARQLVSPLPMLDLRGTALEISVRGGDSYLGLSVLGLALLGAVVGGGAGRAALGVAALCALLAAGSLPAGQEGAPGPFFFVNLALSQVLPPLTQPFRFLSFTSAALAVGAGIGLAALARGRDEGWGGWWKAGLVLTAEALLVGGPATRIPETDLRPESCLASLDGLPAAVLVVGPAGWSREQTNTAALRLQMLHGLPGTHRGIGGWEQAPRDAGFDAALGGFVRALRRPIPPPTFARDVQVLARRGLGWVVLPEAELPAWVGSPERTCGGWAVFRLAGEPSS